MGGVHPGSSSTGLTGYIHASAGIWQLDWGGWFKWLSSLPSGNGHWLVTGRSRRRQLGWLISVFQDHASSTRLDQLPSRDSLLRGQVWTQPSMGPRTPLLPHLSKSQGQLTQSHCKGTRMQGWQEL